MSEESCSAKRVNSVLEEYKQSLNDVYQLIRTPQHNTSDHETGQVIAHLLKKADEIQHLLEDGVNITNLLKPLESGLHFIREIRSKNTADLLQSLGFRESTALRVRLSSKERRGLKRRLKTYASELDRLLSGIRKKEKLQSTTLTNLDLHDNGKLEHLRVAHITDDGLEKIKPKEITESDVVINVTGLSQFGLFRYFSRAVLAPFHFITDIFHTCILGRNIRAMVLVFLQTSPEPTLHVLLLPSNYDIMMVKKKRETVIHPRKEIYIDTNPYCEINTHKYYSLVTEPPGLNVTLNRAQHVECNPGFVSTFTVLCSTEKELKLILKDEEDETKELWNSVVNIEDASELAGLLSGIREKKELRLSTSLTNLDLHDSPDYGYISDDDEVSKSCECLEPLVREEDNGDIKYTLKCPTVGLFKCKFTSLMFKMETAGEVEYHSVPWENKLENHHCKPAGPLYNIECPPGTLVQLHLPHYEVISDRKLEYLRVAHLTCEGLEIIKPKEITESHVVINVTGLSPFGCFTYLTEYFWGSNIQAMVLLFLQISSKPKLQVLLLSKQTDIRMVQHWRKELIDPRKEIYIDTNVDCKINKRKYYRLFTDPARLIVTPIRAPYVECSPNFTPTFTVHCSTEKELTLILKDEMDEKELWKSVVNIEDVAAAAGSSQASSEGWTKYMIGGQHFIDKHRIRLIESITMVEPILDRLLEKNVITYEEYSDISSKPTSTQRMRALMELGGIRTFKAGKDCLYDVLMELQPIIMEELNGMKSTH